MSFELKNLTEKYEKYEKKYKLPTFSELNSAFEIDKIDREPEFLLRVIRKVIMEKIVNSLSFLDMLSNPMNSPRIYHAYIKGMNVKDKEIIDKLYNIFGELSVESIGMELEYNEKKEAEFIGLVYKSWNDVKKDFSEIMDNMMNPNSISDKREKDYFG